ncbi:H-2 class II histocompatibility antigen, A-K alpha chain-like [Genypterus blacodes]|uniref:H-2 class II histocompatibility antigen, A-K alpha chain-like n=1 Tax=Genypterus blacodes TaxID=154954 RepID=UPI003F77183D
MTLMTLDGDRLYYEDHKKGALVWDPRLSDFKVPGFFDEEQEYQHFCQFHLERAKQEESVTKTRYPPEISIYPRDEPVKEEENTLICFIHHFFPPLINVTWTKNNVEVTTEAAFLKSVPNPDGTFHFFSSLTVVPSEGDIYACTVEHEALEKPQSRFWDLTSSESSLGPTVFCGFGLSLGLLGFFCGIFLLC